MTARKISLIHVGFLLSRSTIFLEHLAWRLICAGDFSLEEVLNQRIVQWLHVIPATVDAPVRQGCSLDRYAHLLPFLFLTVQRHGVDVLLVHHIQYRANGQWVLYSEHHGKGYTSSLTFRLQRSDGFEVEKLHTAWTQKGRKFLYHTLKRRGVLPLAEQGG